MRRWRLLAAPWLVAAVLAAAGALAFAAIRGPASPATLDDRVREVAAGLRCPVCQSLSVADSSSQVAREMREEIARDLRAGKSPEEIRAEFAEAYGEWVLEAPPKRGVGLVVWLLPVALLAAGAFVSASALRRWSRRRAEAVPPLSDADRELLARALAEEER